MADVTNLLDITQSRQSAQFSELPASSRGPAISKYKTYYYAGGQAQIYLEDIFLDEVNNLQFSTITNKTPIYGYSSMYFDTIAKGNLLVQGSFTINFVNSDYLNIIAKYIQKRKGQLEDNLAAKLRPRDVTLPEAVVLQPLSFSPFEVQQALNQIRGLGNKEFRILAEKSRVRTSIDTTSERFYNIPAFDIWAVFGDETDPNANHTVRKIKDVHLIAQGQVVGAMGGIIQEEYNFYARDIE